MFSLLIVSTRDLTWSKKQEVVIAFVFDDDLQQVARLIKRRHPSGIHMQTAMIVTTTIIGTVIEFEE